MIGLQVAIPKWPVYKEYYYSYGNYFNASRKVGAGTVI